MSTCIVQVSTAHSLRANSNAVKQYLAKQLYCINELYIHQSDEQKSEIYALENRTNAQQEALIQAGVVRAQLEMQLKEPGTLIEQFVTVISSRFSYFFSRESSDSANSQSNSFSSSFSKEG